MNTTLSKLLLALLVIASLTLYIGCKDDSEDTPPAPPPTAMQLLTADWDATANSLVPVGLDEMKFFLNADSTYRQYLRAGGTDLNEEGTWTAAADSIHWHATLLDNQPVNILYANAYDLQQSNSVLAVSYMFDDGPHQISFTKIP